MPIPKQQFIGSNGRPLAGGKVYTYAAGTTTAKATYTDSGGLTANANPVILDAAGRASIWLNGYYKISLYDSSDVLQYTVDNVSGEPESPTSPYKYANEYDSLNDAITAISTANTTLIVSDSQTLEDDLTVPANVDLQILKTGSITLGNYDLAINGPFKGSPGCFVQNGTGAVTFDAGAVDVVRPEWWTANVTPGTTDMTTAIQAALNAAAGCGGWVVLSGGAYKVSSVRIYNGTKGFICENGSKIIGDGSNPDGIVQLDGPELYSGTAVDGCTVSLKIDMSAGDRTAIKGDGCTNCKLVDNEISGFTNHATLNHYGIFLLYGANNNIIARNKITGYNTPTQRGLLIDICGKGTDYGGYFSGSGTLTRASDPCMGNIITENTLLYGSYAVNLLAAEKNIISANYCRYQNHRSVYTAAACWENTIVGNQFLDNSSSAVVMGYGSCHNLVAFNTCKNEITAHGEASINITTGSSYNVVQGNKIYAGHNYGVYMACDVIGNKIIDNEVENYYLCGIALENDLIETRPTHAVYSRPNYAAPPVGSQWSFNDSTGNIIKGNTIGAAYTGRNVCAIYLAQIDSDGSTSLTNNTVQGNIVNSGDQLAYNLMLYSDTEANHSGEIIRDNQFHSGNTFVSANTSSTSATWNDKIGYWNNNNILDQILGAEQLSFSDGDTTPSVLTNSPQRVFGFANTSGATSVTYFDDGVDGQEIQVRFDTNTTLVHNNSYIRLKGSANAAPGTSNAFMRLRRASGVWFELWRNF